MISNQKDGRGIITIGSSWERHPRNILFMHKRDFEIAGGIRKRIRNKNQYYPPEYYDKNFYFHDVLKDSLSEFKHLLDDSESDFDIYLGNVSVWQNELIGKFIDYLIGEERFYCFSQLDSERSWWDNNAIFVICFEYYMCTIMHREKYSVRLEEITNHFLNASDFLKEKNYAWIKCFLPQLQDFLDEEITTPEIVETFLNIFGVEIEWEVI